MLVFYVIGVAKHIKQKVSGGKKMFDETNFNNHNVITLSLVRGGISLGMEKASRMFITNLSRKPCLRILNRYMSLWKVRVSDVILSFTVSNKGDVQK